VRLSDFHGKIVVLNFWATWCPPCLTEIPDLITLQRLHPDDLVVIGVSLDGVPDDHGHGNAADLGGSLEKVRAVVARTAEARGITYCVLLDPSNSVGSRYNGGELPTNVLIDTRGNVRRRFVGRRSLGTWEQMLAELGPR
jgi:thiol-disulfide isomerase/thioredoxin